VEVDLIVAADFQVFQAAAPGQEVVGQVQDVVALVVRQVPLPEGGAPVGVVGQAGLVGQEGGRPDGARGGVAGPGGEVRADLGGGHHRLGAFDAGPILQAAEDATLAAGETAVDTGVHSKTSWGERARLVKYLDCSPEPGGFRAFRPRSSSNYAWLRALTGC